jgi:hypothetical protein
MLLRKLHEEIQLLEEEVTPDSQGRILLKRIDAARGQELVLLARLAGLEPKQ